MRKRNGDMTAAGVELDLRGLKCPLPVLKTRRALAWIEVGQTMTVICTDPLASIDIPHFLRGAGHVLESSRTSGGEATFVIRKGPLADATTGPEVSMPDL